MNLDLLPLGWVHLVVSLAAMALAVAMLTGPKGTRGHRARGLVYAGVMVATCLTALAIYRRGVFFFPHWLAVAALLLVACGVAAAHFRMPRTAWVHVHLTAMVASCYLLIGGAVNEAFLRVEPFRRLAPDFGSSAAVGLTHAGVMLLFAVLIGYFNAMVKVRRHACAASRWTAAPPDSPLPCVRDPA